MNGRSALGMDMIPWTTIAPHLEPVTFEQLYAHMFHLRRSKKRSDSKHEDKNVTHEMVVPF